MGALITCCRKPKSPQNSNARAVNEEINIKNGEVVVEARADPESKYIYESETGLGEFDGEGEVVEETFEVKEVKGVHAAPPPRPVDSSENGTTDKSPRASGSSFVREQKTSVSGRSANAEFQKTTIIRESVETKTVTQRSSIPLLKPTPEGKQKPKVVIVREY